MDPSSQFDVIGYIRSAGSVDAIRGMRDQIPPSMYAQVIETVGDDIPKVETMKAILRKGTSDQTMFDCAASVRDDVFKLDAVKVILKTGFNSPSLALALVRSIGGDLFKADAVKLFARAGVLHSGHTTAVVALIREGIFKTNAAKALSRYAPPVPPPPKADNTTQGSAAGARFRPDRPAADPGVAPAPVGSSSHLAECRVCLDAAADHAMIPCGHQCVCGACAALIVSGTNSCPLCRAAITSVVKIFA